MKLFTSTLITAAAALTLAGAAQAQVTVTTGGGYIKMVEALTAQYEKTPAQKLKRLSAATSVRCSLRLKAAAR